MALSTGQVNDAFQQAVGRAPTGGELQKYTSDNSFDGSPGQQSLISSLKGGNPSSTPTLQGPGNSGQTQQYLNDYHNLVLKQASDAEKPQESDQQIMDNVKGALLPNTPVPQAPNMSQTFSSLRSDPSITNLETKLADLKTQENTIQTQTMASQAAENGKPVAMNVIQGRQSEEQQQANVQLSALALQKAAVTDELTMRYTMVDNVMKFMQTDYDNAVKTYEEQFAQNQAIYTAFTAQKNFDTQEHDKAMSDAINATATEVNMSEKADEFAYQQQQDVIKNASANLTIMANMITSGNLKYNDLSSDQKLQIQKLEVQSGLGTGFVQNLTRNDPNGKVLYAGANGAVMQLPDGSLKTVNYNVSGPSKLSQGEIQQQDSGIVAGILDSHKNSYGNVTPAVWQSALAAWVKDGYKKADFINNFSNYTDPNRGDFINAYGFNPKDRGGIDTTAATTKNATNNSLLLK